MIEDYQAKRRRTRRLSRLLMSAGLVLAAIAAVVTYVYGSGLGQAPAASEPPKITVVVATRNLDPRTAIAAADLRTIQTSPELVPAGALNSAGAAIGKIVTIPIVTGEVILPNKYREQDGFGFSVFPEGQRPTTAGAPEYRAMSINVGDDHAVGGAVQVGDSVDIIFAVPAPGASPAVSDEGAPTDVAAKIVYQQVPILQRSGSTYTIRVTATQAEEFSALAGAGATIDLLLRAPDDTRTVQQATGARLSTEVGDLLRSIGVSPTATPR